MLCYEEERKRSSILFLSHYDELEGFEPFISLCLVFFTSACKAAPFKTPLLCDFYVVLPEGPKIKRREENGAFRKM